MKSPYLLAFVLLIFNQSLFSQEKAFDENGIAREMVLDENIKTIRLYRQGWINSYPIMTVSSNLPLILDFDELSEYENTFSYMFIHCDANWQQSGLYDQEYQEGYATNRINDYESSFNTYYNFVHYSLSVPNNDIRLTQSGNYLLIVFRDDDPEEIVFTRRFMISEAAVQINATAKRPILSEYRDNSHEIDVTIDHSNFKINDPYSESTLSIYQNGVWDYNVTGLKPLFINPDELIYDYQKENIFMAGNEYRMFSTKTSNVRGIHIQNIEYLPPYMHFELKTDEANPAYLYFEKEDLNGKLFIDNTNGDEADLDADYVYVHFNLKMPLRLDLGEVYIAGALTNWQFNELNKMLYNAEEGMYHGSLLLKQGIYNYRYMFLPNNSSKFDISELEGSHFETENEYLILFYYQGPGDRHDRLVGHQIIHSNER